jgi:hypothetical protein
VQAFRTGPADGLQKLFTNILGNRLTVFAWANILERAVAVCDFLFPTIVKTGDLTMDLRNLAQNDRCAPISNRVAFAALGACLVLAGCGSGVVANLLPTIKPANTTPSGPVLGYVFSPTDGTLRAILGVRGSALLSASIVPSGVYVTGETSVASSSALLEDATGSLFAFNLPNSQPVHVADGLPANVHAAFSSSGQTAIAYGAGSSTITLITGLPATPQIKTINVPATNPLASAIVSDAGTIVIASSGSPMSVGTLSPSGQFSRLTTVASIGGLNFLPGSDDLLIADSAANAVSVIHSVSTSPSSQPLAVTGLNRPVAVSASQDKKWAVIANGGDAGVVRIDLIAGTPAAKVLCACQPSQLSALSGGTAFRLNALYGGPLWIVDLSNPTTQLLFVPAVAKGTP